MMKVLVTGAGGQVGWELQQRLATKYDLYAFSRNELDISNYHDVENRIKAIQPDWVINAAAYTAVDRAEEELEKANAINSEAVGKMVRFCKLYKARFLHISTDYVFDGDSSRSYVPTDQTNPLNIYGKSKLSGELQVLHTLGEDTLIIRTGWVYAAHGNNFVKTMLKLMATRDVINVIEDQVGSPTWAGDFCTIIDLAIQKDARGLFHWTDAGVASWYDFATAIYKNARQIGLLDKDVAINPISSDEYKTKAQRPRNSIMCKRSIRDTLGYTGRHWSETLGDMLMEIKNDH